MTAKILGIKNTEIINNAINNSSMVIQIKVNQKKILFLDDSFPQYSGTVILRRTLLR